MKLNDINAIITGASRGLGRALALQLGQAGAKVVLVARGRRDLEDTVETIRQAGGTAHGLVADLGDKHAVHRIAGEAAALVGPIDLLVNGASTLGPTPLRTLGDTECEDFERVLEVNLLGPFRLAKAVVGSMLVRGHGTVIDISSDAAVQPYPTWGAYAVSKAGLDHLTRVWAKELEGQGVRFLAVDPGDMNTRMHHDAIPDADPADLADPVVVAERVLSMVVTPHRAHNGARLLASQWEASA